MTTTRPSFCCTSPTALCLWAAAFLIVYGAGLLAGELWPALGGFDQTLVLVAIGIACLVTFGITRTFHCGITGPLFLVAAAAVALDEAGLWVVNLSMVWALLMMGLGAAAFVEWRVTTNASPS